MFRNNQLLLAGPLGQQQLLNRSKCRPQAASLCRAEEGRKQINPCPHTKGPVREGLHPSGGSTTAWCQAESQLFISVRHTPAFTVSAKDIEKESWLDA